MPRIKKVAVTGSTGLIGTALVAQLRSDGYQVLKLVRRPPRSADEVSWDPIKGEIDLKSLEDVDAVFHLAGAGVGDKRWTAAYRSEILNSRLLGTTTIANACEQLQPEVFISASAIGYYGETGNREVAEVDRGGDDFLSIVCREWEAVANLAPSVRTIKLRTGLVLDPTGGALGRMIPLFKFGLGGKLGSGKQWWSWITLHDQIRAMIFLMNSQIEGAVNIATPNPVTNKEFTAALAHALKRPAFFPAPAFALRASLGGFSSEILGSKKILPKVLLDNGFEFDYPFVSNALTALVE
ncbi:TIGR01777 family protein [Candidatus Nanopelagicus hibericus]|uniref:TIGR01777 family protein n=1 Tax=Candidatus Nanopelagicus hibericus TaxID=1884915 RepID=A0A249K8W5_9ACTN|nr:TIGR01777 family oxidoreductase [Candidatus Nanopelagicus hibericus]ASY13227.1 TIGR01777 family protein [Candidatus Nanopelagicus hibericus]